jgi:DNA-directed RNA polymerase specialized sigma54-like protein
MRPLSPTASVAEHFGAHDSTVSRAVRRFERGDAG